jgi:hypothetical protein
VRPGGLFHGYVRDDPESYYTTIGDPGSPTDVEDDDYYTPPSPTISAVHRRVEASALIPSPNPRKRPSNDSNHGSSTKLTKTFKGKQPANSDVPNVAPTFKRPSLGMARSFQQADTVTASSANTSFDTVWSSQRTLVESAATSFTADGANEDIEDLRLTRKSSTSLESFRDSDLFELATTERKQFELERKREQHRFYSQEESRESNTSYGSIDKDVFLHATNEAEADTKPISGPVSAMHTNRSNVSPSKSALLPAQTLPSPVTPGKGVSANTPHSESPRNAQVEHTESPAKLAWFIRDLPTSNLFVEDLPNSLKHCPFFLAFIGCRIAVANSVPLIDVIGDLDVPHALESSDFFWSTINQNLKTVPRDSTVVWTAARKVFEGYTFKGKVVFESARKGPVFRLDLLPIHPETSCLFQRMFGSDRFLYLTFPSFQEKHDRFSQAEMLQIEAQWSEWKHRPHSFLGRTWRVFHVEPMKRKGIVRKVGDNGADIRVILFATDGVGIDLPMLIGEMIGQFFNFADNEYQNFCKAFSRMDLGLSRTIPTLVFMPSQIRRKPDVLADGTPDAQDFNDSNLDWSEHCDEQPVMNDGCAQVSVGAAQMIWKSYQHTTGSDEPLPSAFQGRIGGAKGMWMLSAEPHTRDPAHLKIWIEIADSQLKFEPVHDDKADDRPYNSHRLTFNYLKHSYVNGSTDLHISFIPILVDRGVGRDVIADFMIERLDQERKQLMDMLHDPVRLHNWITKQGSATPALGILPWQAALPLSLPEKAKLLLRTGFLPDQSPFLAKSLKQFVKQRQIWMEEKLRAPLGKATFLLGLADPLGVLQPGEVHVHFSSPFLDEFDRKTYRNLTGEDVLVARQPACRRSDIQKMKAVSHPKLSHLVDVIVFPSVGEYPAAGKLQGGDYDGDTFWTCWDPILVTPFRNAPAPMKALDPSKYGIKKDTRKLNEIMNPHDLSTVDNFLRKALDFRTAPSLLGKATVFAEKVAYKQNRIHSDELSALYDVHDLLVDAPKQAFKYDDKAFNDLVRFRLKCGKPGIPAYKQAMEASAKLKSMGEEEKDGLNSLKHNPRNILDFLYFDVVKKHNRATRKALEDALPKEFEDDPELQLPFIQLRDNDSTLNRELDSLLVKIVKIVQNWNRSLGDKTELSPDRYNTLMDNCYTAFRALLPSPENVTHPQIAPLVFQYLGPKHPTLWENIRASALYTTYPKKHAFVWHMAGRELARLKAAADADTYNVVPGVFADLKTKACRVVKPEGEEREEEFEGEGEGSAS